jgi:hypothetical protein
VHEEHRAEHLAADQQRLAARAGVELAAELAVEQVGLLAAAIVPAAEADREAGAGLAGLLERVLQPRAGGCRRGQLERLVRVGTDEDDGGAVGDRALEVAPAASAGE